MGKLPIRSRMGIFTLILIVVWFLRLIPAIRRLLSPAQQLVLDLTGFLVVIPAIYYAWKLFAFVRRELLWKIRRRLILAHIFVGVIPVILVLTILYVSGPPGLVDLAVSGFVEHRRGGRGGCDRGSVCRTVDFEADAESLRLRE